MKGKISAIIKRRSPESRDGGFGFIIDEEGNERFFHARHLYPKSLQARFESLTEGLEVTFNPINVPGRGNGLRAEHVELV